MAGKPSREGRRSHHDRGSPVRSHPFDAFAVAAPGLEPIVAGELRALGIDVRAEPGGVSFPASDESIYAANIHLRTASRILLRMGEFEATAFHELERRSTRLPWERILALGAPIAVRTTCRKSKLYHSDAVTERVVRAAERAVGGVTVVQPASEEDGEGASPEPQDEGREAPLPQLIVVRVAHDRVTISADTSGALLHLRGYRKALARAPLRETLAAALLLGAEWDPATPLLDPMCGAGTIVIEAALLARRIAPGLGRAFGFEGWPGFDRALRDRLVAEARAAILPAAPAPLRGSDRDAGAIEAAVANAERAGVAGDVGFERRSLSAVESFGESPGWIVTNPPYGVRVGESAPLRDLYARLGQLARARFVGWRLAMLAADRGLEGQLRAQLTERFRTRNGGIPVRLVVARIPG